MSRPDMSLYLFILNSVTLYHKVKGNLTLVNNKMLCKASIINISYKHQLQPDNASRS